MPGDGAVVTGAGGEPGLQRDAVVVADEHAGQRVLVAEQRVGVERVVDEDEADRALGLDELRLLDTAAAAAAPRADDDPAGERRLVAGVVEAERVADGRGVDDRGRREGAGDALALDVGKRPGAAGEVGEDVAVVAVVRRGADGREPRGVGR